MLAQHGLLQRCRQAATSTPVAAPSSLPHLLHRLIQQQQQHHNQQQQHRRSVVVCAGNVRVWWGRRQQQADAAAVPHARLRVRTAADAPTPCTCTQISPNDLRNGLNVEIEGVPFKVGHAACGHMPPPRMHDPTRPVRRAAPRACCAPRTHTACATTQVVEFLHVKPGKGAAFVRSKLRNLLNGGVVERTFRTNEQLGTPDLSRREAQFTYAEGDEYIFMDQETYEETRLKRDPDWANFLLEGAKCELLFFNGKVISVDPPQFVELEITDCPPNVKGNTASGAPVAAGAQQQLRESSSSTAHRIHTHARARHAPHAGGGTKAATLETGAVIQVPAFLDQGVKVKIDTRTGQYLSKA